MKKYFREINGVEVKSVFKREEEFKVDSNKLVTQISGVCFTRFGEVLIISGRSGKWGIPGGKPEEGESFEETLRREVEEEANVLIESILPLGFLEINFPGNPNKLEGDLFYQGRFFAIITEIMEMDTDPATGKLFERKFISPEDFTKYINWQDAEDLIKFAQEKFQNINIGKD